MSDNIDTQFWHLLKSDQFKQKIQPLIASYRNQPSETGYEQLCEQVLNILRSDLGKIRENKPQEIQRIINCHHDSIIDFINGSLKIGTGDLLVVVVGTAMLVWFWGLMEIL